MKAEWLTELRYRFVPDHIIGEVLSKKWADNFVPALALLALVVGFEIAGQKVLDPLALPDLARQFAELGILCFALTIVMISGGIDVSIGSNFALAGLAALTSMNVLGLSIGVSFLVAIAVGMLCGALNGFLIGFVRLRAFLTTLVTLIIYRSIYDLGFGMLSTEIATNMPDSDLWEYLGEGTVFGVPWTLLLAVAIGLTIHVVLTRMRFGWHLMAVGGARKSAFNAGIRVRSTIFTTYLTCGGLCGLAGFLSAARLSNVGADTGVGLEVQALTAVVVGGVSLGGGRGSIVKATLGALFVLILTNNLISFGVGGPMASLILGFVLLLAVFTDVRWLKNREKILGKIYVAPTYARLPDLRTVREQLGAAFGLNDALRDVAVIGLGMVEAPEDVILDRNDHLYCGTRTGDIARFFAPDYKRMEIFAHIGGLPLGLTFDKHDNLVVCVGSMGLYQVSPDRKVSKLTDETNRSYLSIVDDSRLLMADDVDIAPDGRMFFTEATVRYGTHDWPVDAIESRGNGRIICYDPSTKRTNTVLRGLIFPNGICMTEDGQSLLFAETWACRVSRYWFDGPKCGRVEVVIPALPGYPDNINRASDGNFWAALVGMRTPALDLALRMPGFRRRMALRVSSDNWLYPNINTGCIIKFDIKGRILDTLWDLGGANHPMVTSMREHKGSLFVGGVSNNRIGRLKLPNARPDWTAAESYWGIK